MVVTLNNFDYFITITLDEKLIDRYNQKEIFKKTRKWLDNMVQRKRLKYVMVAEFHKNKAVHFHAFINKGTLNIIESDTRIVKNFSKPVKLDTIRKHKIPQEDILRTVFNNKKLHTRMQKLRKSLGVPHSLQRRNKI